MADAIYSGQKILAIKQLRDASGLGLKEAKDVVEKLEGELRAEHPERFTSKSSKSGCTSIVMLLVVAVGLLVFFLRR